MVDAFGHDDLRQQAGPGRALFDRLRRLGGRSHRASASVFLTDILDDGQLRRSLSSGSTCSAGGPLRLTEGILPGSSGLGMCTRSR